MIDSNLKESYCLTCCREIASGTCSFCSSEEADSTSASNHHLPPGTMLRGEDYMLGRVLGSGGFGVTYLAVDVQLGKRLAIKELLPTSVATRVSDGVTVAPISEGAREIFQSSVEGFLREAKTLVPFDEHPNIVSVVKFFEENGTAYLVMPYLEGQTLDEYLKSQGGRLDEEEALIITQCVLDALRATHKRNLLHRDVKPHNVYLTKDGPIKLIDFGSARQVVGEQSKSMSAVVTDGYAPFEQYQSRGKQGPWTDLYAVGALLFRMLTGENPPTATDRVFDDGLKSLQEIARFGVNPQVCRTLIKALAVRPEDRFQTVEELEKALRGEIPSCRSQNRDTDPLSQQEEHDSTAAEGISLTSRGTARGRGVAKTRVVQEPGTGGKSAPAVNSGGKNAGDAQVGQITSAEYYKRTHDLHYKSKQYLEALHGYRSIIELFPNCPETGYSRTQIGNILEMNLTRIKREDWECFTKWTAETPEIESETEQSIEVMAQDLYKKANSLDHKQGNSGEAVSVYREIIQRFADTKEAYWAGLRVNELSRISTERIKIEEALSKANTPVKIYKLSHELHYNYKQYKKALFGYRKIVENFPNSPEAGYSRTQIGNILEMGIEINDREAWERIAR